MTTLPMTTSETAFPVRGLPTHVGLAEAFQQTLTMAWRATLKMRRNLEQSFDVIIQPLLFTAMFAGIFGGAISGSVQDYLPLLIPGLVGQSVLTACIATGTQLREDIDKGVFDRFKVLPIARVAPLAGPMVADMLRYLIAGSLTFITGMVIGYRPVFTALGIAAAYLAALLGLSFYLRRWIGPRRWRRLHRLMAVVYALALVHALGAGTDAGTPWLRTVLLGTAVPLVPLLVLRRRTAARRARRRPVPASSEAV